MPIASPADFEVKPEEVQLPSQKGTDKAVLLRRPDLIALISEEGEIPSVLTNMLMALVNGKSTKTEIDQENLPQIMQAMNVICMACFVQPKLWNQPNAEGEYMPVSWLSFTDRSFVFGWALGAEYKPVESFRSQPNGSVAVVPPVRGTTRSPKRSVGDRA